jgi:DNA topoisomerase-3
MANPESYDEKYAKWNIKDLPIIPEEYKYVISKATRKQFNILKKLMNDKETDTVINACDAGREGESIFRLVYLQANCKKNMKRLWISSMEDSAIKDGFNNLKDGKEYDNLFESAQTRAIADWLVGMNISRLYSCLFKQNYSVGRVQTPTLSMIVKRDDEIANFKKEKYYTLELALDGFTLSMDRIDSPEIAEDLKNAIRDTITIKNVEKKEKIAKPDLPLDLTTLQRECNKYFGFSAKQTLDYAQSLYEKKLITYPRTDSRHLTEDMITSTINNILGKNDFDKERIKVIFNSSKVTDHHAIIPTVSSLSEGISKLPESEVKVYRLILNKFHASISYPLIENTTKIVAEYERQGDVFEFKASGKVIVDKGFTKYLEEYKSKKNEDVVLPDVNIGDVFDVKNKEIKEKYTTPPKHFTEDTLLKAMETAGNDALEKDVEVERKGLGTPATRAGIIENLIYKGFIERDKKNLVATHKGISLVTIVANVFKSAETTAKWEMELSDIAKGKSSKKDFLENIKDQIEKVIEQYQKSE